MKKSVITLIAVATVFIGIGFYSINVYNSFIRQENGIVAVHEDLQNVHASMFNNLKSQGLSVEKYGGMVIEAINAAISGRYGKDGARGAMLWIQEQNPTIDQKVFERLQVAIESGYNRFEEAQRTKIDRLRVYDNELESFMPGLLARSLYGFPRKVTEELRATITTAETREMVATKEMKAVDPFSKK